MNTRPVRAFIAPIAISVALALTIGAFALARRTEVARAEAEFRGRAIQHYNTLQISLQRSVESLETVKLLFQTSTNVGRSEFMEITTEVTKAHPEIAVLEWAPRVRHEERAAFEATLRKEISAFEIFDRDAATNLVRSPERPEYYPLLYVDRIDRVGFDALGGVARRELEQARDSGLAALSTPVHFRLMSNEMGLILTLPVYAPGTHDSVEQRRANIRGVLRGLFRINDLVDVAWRRMQIVGMDTMVVDTTAPSSNIVVFFHPSVLHPTKPRMATEEEMRAGLHHEVQMQVAGRTWAFLFRPIPAWWRSQYTWYPYVLLFAGLAFTAVMAAYLRASLRRAGLVERTVAERTAALEQTNQQLSREIAERRRTEDELRRSEGRLIEAQRIGRIGSWERDLITDHLEWSHEVFRIFGRDPSSYTPTPSDFFNSVHPEDRPHVAAIAQRALDRDSKYYVEHRIRRPDGTEHRVVEHAEVIRDAAGKAVRMVGTVQDITDRRSMEARLEFEHRLLETVIESLPDQIFAKDRDGRFTRVNTACWRAAGCRDASEMIGRTDGDVLPKEVAPVFIADDREVLEKRQPIVNREEAFINAQGEQRWLLTTKVPLMDYQGEVTGLVGISRDITEKHNADEQRRVIERKFQETQKLESLGVLAGGIAHDFNNLLTGIMGHASLARMDLPPESPLQPYLEQIELSSQRAADLCKQMLAYSGKGRFVIQPLDLSALIQETLHLIQLSITKKAVLKLEVARNLPVVMADATQLRQIVMNLVTNASEAIGDRSGVIIVRTTVMHADKEYLSELGASDALAEGSYVVLEVTDNGCGMSAETKARIFEPFFTTKFTGRGLGLAAVLGIVRGHKGTLKVYSEEGKGSTFKLLLPAADGAVRHTDKAMQPPRARACGTVLVVDDEETVRTVVTRMCQTLGFEVLTAHDGAHGVEIYRAGSDRIQAVLLDLTMPRMDGEETFREIRRINPNAYVLLMSGFNEQDAVARFVGKGLAGFVQKPFSPDQLREKLKTFFSDPGI